MSLFLQSSRAFNCALSIQVNHRQVDCEFFSVKNEQGVTLKDCIENEGFDGFQSSVIMVYPYVVKYCPSKAIYDDLSADLIISLGSANFSWRTDEGKETKCNAELVLDNAVAVPLTQAHFEVLCYFFDVKPQHVERVDSSDGEPKSIFNWGALFDKDNLIGTSVESIDAFCVKRKLPFRCKGANVAQNNRRFRDFVQFCVPVRISMVEGNHRMEAACRRFYGINVDESYTLDPGELPPPVLGSTLCGLYNLIVVQTPNEEVVSPRLQQTLQYASRSFQKSKGKMILSSWKTLMQSLVRSLPSIKQRSYVTLFNEKGYDVLQAVESKIYDQMVKKGILQAVNTGLVPSHFVNENMFEEELKKKFCHEHHWAFVCGIVKTPTMHEQRKANAYECIAHPKLSMIVWFMKLFGTSQRGQEMLQLFYGSNLTRIHDMEFLCVFVATPVNHIANRLQQTVSDLLEKKYNAGTGNICRLKKKLHLLYRIMFGEMYLHILKEYGRNPTFESQPLVDVAKNGKFGVAAQTSKSSKRSEDSFSSRSMLALDGITQIVFFYWPQVLGSDEFLKEKVDALLQNDHYYNRFQQHMPDFQPKEGGTGEFRHQNCFCVPAEFDLQLNFVSILSGKYQLSSLISPKIAANGIVSKRAPRKKFMHSTTTFAKIPSIPAVAETASVEDSTSFSSMSSPSVPSKMFCKPSQNPPPGGTPTTKIPSPLRRQTYSRKSKPKRRGTPPSSSGDEADEGTESDADYQHSENESLPAPSGQKRSTTDPSNPIESPPVKKSRGLGTKGSPETTPKSKSDPESLKKQKEGHEELVKQHIFLLKLEIKVGANGWTPETRADLLHFNAHRLLVDLDSNLDNRDNQLLRTKVLRLFVHLSGLSTEHAIKKETSSQVDKDVEQQQTNRIATEQSKDVSSVKKQCMGKESDSHRDVDSEDKDNSSLEEDEQDSSNVTPIIESATTDSNKYVPIQEPNSTQTIDPETNADAESKDPSEDASESNTNLSDSEDDENSNP